MSKDSPVGLKLIAILKLVKGLLLLGLGIGVLNFLHKDVATVLEYWINAFRVDPNNHYIHELIAKRGSLDKHMLEAISAGTFFYSALMLTEGIGLWLAMRWAAYLTVIATSSFIPLEVYQIYKHVSLAKLVVLGINIMVVWYLVIRLRRDLRVTTR